MNRRENKRPFVLFKWFGCGDNQKLSWQQMILTIRHMRKAAWVGFFVLSGASALHAVVGDVSTFAGRGRYYGDGGPALQGAFNSPSGIAMASDGTLYIADTYNLAIRVISPQGTLSTLTNAITFPGRLAYLDGFLYVSGYPVKRVDVQNGSTINLGFNSAKFSVDQGLLYGDDGQIFKYDPQSQTRTNLTTGGKKGLAVRGDALYYIDGTTVYHYSLSNGTSATLGEVSPHAVSIVADDTWIYVTESYPFPYAPADALSDVHRVIRMRVSDGFSEVVAGGMSGDRDGIGEAAAFQYPQQLALDESGSLYVVDMFNGKIKKIDLATRQATTIAGEGLPDVNVSALQTTFNTPLNITEDDYGNMYVSDIGEQRILRISEGGTVTTLAGSGMKGSQDGAGNQATFRYPCGVATDSQYVYAADFGNHKIRRISIASGNVDTLADGFLFPWMLTYGDGKLYVSDTGSCQIKEVDVVTGEVTILAGSSCGDRDGIGTEAQFNWPRGISLHEDHLYVADAGNDKVRRIDLHTKEVTTVAGTGWGGYQDGSKEMAAFWQPWGVSWTVDKVFVADTVNNVIRQIRKEDGYTTTLAGSGAWGSQDGSGAQATFAYPHGLLAELSLGRLLVSDTFNHKIRSIEIEPVYEGPIWYVALDGSDALGDGSESHPFRSIHRALQWAHHGHTIQVGEGTYPEYVELKEGIKLFGAGRDKTILDGSGVWDPAHSGDGQSAVIHVHTGVTGVEIKGFTITNRFHGIFMDQGSQALIENNTVAGNQWNNITLNGSASVIRRNIIAGKSSYSNLTAHAGIDAWLKSDAQVINNTVANTTEAGICFFKNSVPDVRNNILYGNKRAFYNPDGSSRGVYAYNLLWGNLTDFENMNQVEILETVEADPLFVDVGSGDYRLYAHSPAVDAGDPDSIYNEADGSRADIGYTNETVFMDIYPPVSSVLTPAEGDIVLGLSPMISGTAMDEHSNLAKIEISLEDETEGTHWDGDVWDLDEFWLLASGLSDWSLQAPKLQDGHVYAVRNRAEDELGNLETPSGKTRFNFKGRAVWYVMKNGDDSNGDGSEQSPFLTIQRAMEEADSGNTIHVGAGEYVESVVMDQGVNLLGAGADQTIINGGGQWDSAHHQDGRSAVINISAGVQGALVKGFTITNRFHGVFIGQNADAVIEFNIISGNGWNNITIDGSPSVIRRNLLLGKSKYSELVAVAGIDAWKKSDSEVVNNTIVGASEAGICFYDHSEPVVKNNILYGNKRAFVNPDGTSTGVYAYNLLWENETNFENMDSVVPSHTLESDPLFVGGESGDYRLYAHSPAVDAGDPDPAYDDPDGTRANIGYTHETIFIDVLPPVSLMTFPKDGSIQPGAVVISGTAQDEHSDVQQVEVSFLDDTTGLYWSGLEWAESESWFLALGKDNWIFEFLSGDDHHFYRVKSRAKDIKGNLEVPSEGIRFEYVGAPLAPVITKYPSETIDSTVAIGGTAGPDHHITLYVRSTLGELTSTLEGDADDAGVWKIPTVPVVLGTNRISARSEGRLKLLSEESEAVLVLRRSLPLPPTDLTAEVVSGSEVRLDWAVSASQDVLAYHVYMGQENIDFNEPVFILPHPQHTYLVPGLTSEVTYLFAVRAAIDLGEEKNENIVSATPRNPEDPGNACLSAKIKAPHNGRKIAGERVTIISELICGEPKDVKEIRFEYKTGDSKVWILIPAANENHLNPDTSFPYFVHWNVSALENGEYQIRSVTVGQDDVKDDAPDFVTIHVDHVDPDVVERKEADGSHLKVEKVGNHKDNVVQTGTDRGVTKITIPKGALTEEKTKIRIIVNPPQVPPPPQDTESAGVTVEINLENGQHQLSKKAEIVLPYRDDDDDGREDDTGADVKKLIIFYFNEETQTWEKQNSTVDLVKKCVRIHTDHFSLYAVFAEVLEASLAGSADATFQLGEVYAFPNPAKMGQTPKIHAEVGLADSVQFRIYDMAGDFVHEGEMSGSTAIVIDGRYAYEYAWDVNGVASGVYLYVIKARKAGKTTLRKSGKVAVIK